MALYVEHIEHTHSCGVCVCVFLANTFGETPQKNTGLRTKSSAYTYEVYTCLPACNRYVNHLLITARRFYPQRLQTAVSACTAAV